jgi:hypothetical protein
MFQIVSNPFVQMTQGVVSNGLGYATERSEKSEDFVWFWKIVIVILTVVGVILISNYHDKRNLRILEEERERQKLIKNQKEITS